MVASWPSGAVVGPAKQPVKWLADENFRSAILRGLLREAPALDILRAQDIREIAGQDDRVLLRFATAEGRVVVTHDLSTMIPAMREQMRIESRCAPIVMVPDSIPVGAAVEDLLVLDGCAVEADWAAGVLYIPLR
jgi:Domain of unknown function (DUF5615)